MSTFKELAKAWWQIHPSYWDLKTKSDAHDDVYHQVDEQVENVLANPETAALLIEEAVLSCPAPEAMSFVGTALVEDAWHLSGVPVPEVMKLVRLEPAQYEAVIEGVLPSLLEPEPELRTEPSESEGRDI